MQTSLDPYDAVLLLSFGGPEAPEEVMPFLRRVTAGRGIPDERLEQVGEHYHLFGGRSPINDQNRALIAALRAELDSARRRPPGALGQPELAALPRRRPARGRTPQGHRRILVVTTSAYSCYSSCRQYRENLADAARRRARGGPWTCRSTRSDRTPPGPGFEARQPRPARRVDAGARRRSGRRDRPALRHALHPGDDGRDLRAR